MAMEKDKMFQVSTLQSLMMGYTRPVITVKELLQHGNTGLGTFEDVNGEMIVAGGHCFQAYDDGTVKEASEDTGVPFASVAFLDEEMTFEVSGVKDIDTLKDELNLKVEEWFGINSMHIVRIDGEFERVAARSESPYRSQHVALKDILSETQKSFEFDDVEGTMICVYYPDYMDGINAPGWHLHFLSADRSRGGHVFDLSLKRGIAIMDKLPNIEIKLPTEPAFDTYSLKQAPNDDIKKVEQGK